MNFFDLCVTSQAGKASAPIQYLSMLQVDVLHFSHFPTWQTLGLWLCLGLSSSGSWILILARGSLWQAHSLIRMQGASSALALKSTAEAALLLLPGAGGQQSRPCPCLCLYPLTFVSVLWSWWNSGSRLHPFQSHKPGHSCKDLRGESAWHGTDASPRRAEHGPGTWHGCLLSFRAVMWGNRSLRKDVECKIHVS